MLLLKGRFLTEVPVEFPSKGDTWCHPARWQDRETVLKLGGNHTSTVLLGEPEINNIKLGLSAFVHTYGRERKPHPFLAVRATLTCGILHGRRWWTSWSLLNHTCPWYLITRALHRSIQGSVLLLRHTHTQRHTQRDTQAPLGTLFQTEYLFIPQL